PDRVHSRTRKRPPRRCPGRPVVRRCGQTTGPPESPARNEDTPRYATGSTTCRCSRGSTGRRRSCWTGSRTALLLSLMSGWPTHRNVVDRGRPYAPSRVRTTPFPEFIGIPRQPGRSRPEERRTPFLHVTEQPSPARRHPSPGRAHDATTPLPLLARAGGPTSAPEHRLAHFSPRSRLPAPWPARRRCRRRPVGFRTFRTHLPTPTNRASPTTGERRHDGRPPRRDRRRRLGRGDVHRPVRPRVAPRVV